MVGIKSRVLHRHKGIAKPRRHSSNGDHHAVFRALVIRDQVALRVIEKACLRLLVDLLYIKGGRCFYISFADADHGAQTGQACDQNKHKNQPESIHKDR